jgi:aminoglycoside phosphotransferase (APT) family kinase protein
MSIVAKASWRTSESSAPHLRLVAAASVAIAAMNRPVHDLDNFGGLLNWERLQAWIDGQDLPGAGPVTGVDRLASGTQNNIFRLHRQGADLVLRRPPQHLRMNSNSTMIREARVLSALASTAVPHPTMYALCADDAVIGACFYLMESVGGFTPHHMLPGRYAADSSWRAEMGYEIVQTAATLGAIRPDEVGLEDFGRPDGWVGRQVSRWQSQLESYRQIDGYSDSELPAVGRVARWLDQEQPSEYRVGIIHGDLQFTNVRFELDQPVLIALLDWELSTLGDPLLDLGWILASWSEPGDPPGHPPEVEPFTDFPSRAEVIDRYLAVTGRNPSLVRWYFVLACYKLGIILEGTWARSRAGHAEPEVGERLHKRAMWLISKAEQLLSATRESWI